MIQIFLSILFFTFYIELIAQYPPAAGQSGTTAIHADSNCFKNWAKSCTIVRGYVRIDDTTFTVNGSNKATWGSPENAIGKADNQVVSLGDKGYVICEFDPPISNGYGWDFAVFENGFNDYFLELAFVEVSSDGIHFFRFPAYSLTPTSQQVSTFGLLDPTKIHNLAGKYRVLYGTPFDLDSLPDHPLLDKNQITKVKVIDVCGSINPLFASFDSQNRIINDPFPTPFESSGFDLDAIGAINIYTDLPQYKLDISIYPNPASEFIQIDTKSQIELVQIINSLGQITYSQKNSTTINIKHLPPGLYKVNIIFKNGRNYRTILVKS